MDNKTKKMFRNPLFYLVFIPMLIILAISGYSFYIIKNYILSLIGIIMYLMIGLYFWIWDYERLKKEI